MFQFSMLISIQVISVMFMPPACGYIAIFVQEHLDHSMTGVTHIVWHAHRYIREILDLVYHPLFRNGIIIPKGSILGLKWCRQLWGSNWGSLDFANHT